VNENEKRAPDIHRKSFEACETMSSERNLQFILRSAASHSSPRGPPGALLAKIHSHSFAHKTNKKAPNQPTNRTAESEQKELLLWLCTL
jgi:hypothetical protein